MGRETRKAKRAPASLKVRFRAATVGEFIEQQISNLSAGGIFIKSKSPLPRGTLMVFEFQLKDGAPLIKGVGRVVWTRREENAAGEPAGMGIKFIRIEPESRETFESIMAGKSEDRTGKDVVATLEPGVGASVAERPDPLASGRPVRPGRDAPRPAGVAEAEHFAAAAAAALDGESSPSEKGQVLGGQVLARVELKAADGSARAKAEPSPAGPSPLPLDDDLLPQPSEDRRERDTADVWTPAPAARSVESMPPSLDLDEDVAEEEPLEPPGAAPAPKPRFEGSGPALLPPPDAEPGSALELAEPDDFAGLLEAAEAAKPEPEEAAGDEDDDDFAFSALDGLAEEEPAAAAEEEPAPEPEPVTEQAPPEATPDDLDAVASAEPVALGPLTPSPDPALETPLIVAMEAPPPSPVVAPRPSPQETEAAPAPRATGPSEPRAASVPAPASRATGPSEPRAAVPAPPERRSTATVVIVVVLAIALLGASAFLAKLLMDRRAATAPEVPGRGAVTAQAVDAASHGPPSGPGVAAPAPDAAAAPGDASPAGGADAGPDEAAGDGGSEMVFGPDDGVEAREDASAGAPTPRTRTLVVRSEPPDTPVAIDGQARGRTPVTVSGSEVSLDGPIIVRLSRSGYDNWSENIRPDDSRWHEGPDGLVLELDVTMTAH